MHRLIKPLIYSVVLLIICFSILFFLVFDFHREHSSIGVAEAQDFANLASITKQLLKNTNSKQTSIVIVADKQEITSATKVLQSQSSPSYVDFSLNSGRLNFYISHPVIGPLWLNLVINYTNTSGALPHSIKVGKLTLPSYVSDPLILKLLDHYTHEELETDTLDDIELRFLSNQSEIKVKPSILSNLKLARLMNAVSRSNNALPNIESPLLNYYRQAFLSLARTKSGNNNAGDSVGYYLSQIDDIPLASTTISRHQHAKYCLLALSTLAGVPYYTDLFTINSKSTARINFTLNGRKDLAKHFLISAGMRILSNQATSFAVGVAKELMDSKNGGSGFSFIDLSADQAGISLVDHLTKIGDDKLNIQSESDFYPSFNDLKEGLSEKEFNQRYTSTNSQEYLELVQKIEKRITSTPLYN